MKLVAAKKRIQRARKVEETLEHQHFWIELSSFDLFCQYVNNLGKASDSEILYIEECSSMILDFISYASRHIVRPRPEGHSSITIPNELIRQSFDIFVQKLFVESQYSQSMTTFGFLLTAVTKHLNQSGEISANLKQSLLNTQLNLSKIFQVLLRTEVYCDRAKRSVSIYPEHRKFILEILQLSQQEVLNFNFLNCEIATVSTLYFFSNLELCAHYDYCVQAIDYHRLLGELEISLLRLHDPTFIADLSPYATLESQNKGPKALWVVYMLTKILSSSHKTATAEFAERLEQKAEDLTENPIAAKIEELITKTKIFEKISGAKVFEESELAYIATRFYLALRFAILNKRYSADPISYENDKEFFDFMDFCSKFYQQPWENMYELGMVLDSCKEESLRKRYLIDGKIIEGMLLLSFTGNSLIPFKPEKKKTINLLKAIPKEGPEFQLILDLIEKSNNIKFSLIKQQFEEVEKHWYKCKNGGEKESHDYYQAIRRLRGQDCYLELLHRLLHKFAYPSLNEERRNSIERTNIEWLAHPSAVLFSYSNYFLFAQSTILKPKKYPDILELHLQNFVDIQFEISKVDLKKLDILRQKNLDLLCDHYDNAGNFNSQYFSGRPSPDSVRFAHYLEFIFNWMNCLQNLWRQAKNKQPRKIFSLIEKFTSKVDLSVPAFLKIGIRIFLETSVQYLQNDVEAEKSNAPFSRLYGRISKNFSKSKFCKQWIAFLRNSLHLISFTEKEHELQYWSELNLLEELIPIHPKDLKNKKLFMMKVFQNEMVSQLVLTATMPEITFTKRKPKEEENKSKKKKRRRKVSGHIKGQKMLVLGIFLSHQNLSYLFNWYTALESRISLFDSSILNMKNELLDRLLNVLKQTTAIEIMKENQKDGYLKQCSEVFDVFIDILPTLASGSMLLFSDMSVFPQGCQELHAQLIADLSYEGTDLSSHQAKKNKLIQHLLELRHSPNYLKKEPQKDEFNLSFQTSPEIYNEVTQFWQQGPESDYKINKVAAACTSFLKDEDPVLESRLGSLLQMYYLTRIILRGENDSSFDKRLEILFAIGQDLIQDSFLKLIKPPADEETSNYILNSILQLRDLTNNLLITVSQGLIPYYLKLEDDAPKKRASWNLIRSLLIQSYKRWKSWEKGDTDLTVHDYPIENLFGILNFLYVTYNENEIDHINHILHDKEIVQLLTTPHQNFANSTEIEALFLARVLSSFENKDVKLEIDLNFAAIHSSKNSEFKSFLNDPMKSHDDYLPPWLQDWLLSTFNMAASPENASDHGVVIVSLKAPIEDLCKLRFTVKEPIEVLEYLQYSIDPIAKKLVDNLCESLEEILAEVHLSLQIGCRRLGYVLIHLLTLVESHYYIIPYLLSKKLLWRPKEKDLGKIIYLPIQCDTEAENGIPFLKMIMEAAFVYQPQLVDFLIREIIIISMKIPLGASSDPKKPLNLGIDFTFEFLKILNWCITTSSKKCRQKEVLTMYMLKLVNNYLGLMFAVNKDMPTLLENFPYLEKIEVLNQLSKMVKDFYFGSLEQRESVFMALVTNFTEVYLKACQENLSLEFGRSWIFRNVSFILYHLDKLTENLKPSKYSSCATVVSGLTAHKSEEPIFFDSKTNIQFTKYSLKDPEITVHCTRAKYHNSWFEHNFREKQKVRDENDDQLCHTLAEALVGIETQIDYMCKFYSLYTGASSKSSHDLVQNYFKAQESSSQLTLISNLATQIFNYLKTQDPSQPKQESNLDSHKTSAHPAELKSTLEIEGIEEEKINCEDQNSSKVKELAEENKVANMTQEEKSVDLKELELKELEASLEGLPTLQKQFVECLFTHELRYHLPNATPPISQIMSLRKNFLIDYSKRLSFFKQKLFLQFLPAFLRDQLEGEEILEIRENYKTKIRATFPEKDISKYNQSEVFDLLNRYCPIEKESPVEIYHPTDQIFSYHDENKSESESGEPDSEEYGQEQEKNMLVKYSRFSTSEGDIHRALNAITWLHLDDREILTIALNIISKTTDKEFYMNILLNPLNELRTTAVLMEIIEDTSLTAYDTITTELKVKSPLRDYDTIATNILAFLSTCNPFDFDISLRAPNNVMKKFVPSLLKARETENGVTMKTEEEKKGYEGNIYAPRNAFERIVVLLDNKKYSENELFMQIIQLLHSYSVDGNPLYVVEDPSKFLHGEVRYKIFSIDFAKKLWMSLKSLLKLEHNEKVVEILIQLLKNYSLFESVRDELMKFYLSLLIKCAEQMAEMIPVLKNAKDLSEFQESLSQLNKTEEMRLLQAVISIICGAVLTHFEDVRGKKDFDLKDKKLGGTLSKWISIANRFVSELSQTKLASEFIFSGFEITYLESEFQDSKNHKEPSPTTGTLFELLINLKSLFVLVEDISTPVESPEEFIEGFPVPKHLTVLRMIPSADVDESIEQISFSKTLPSSNSEEERTKLSGFYKTYLLKIKRWFVVRLVNRVLDSRAKNLFCLKYPFFLDLSQREQISQIREAPSNTRVFNIDRKTHLLDSIEAYTQLSKEERAKLRPKISYKNEVGSDVGGLLRGWFVENTKILFHPSFGLFRATQNQRIVHPSVAAKTIPEYLRYFEYAGYHVAMAIRTKCMIDVHFSRSFYKMIIDRPLTINDLEELDHSLCTSLKWLLDNDCESLGLTFSYELDVCGERHTVELIQNGTNVAVTNKNKATFVNLLAVAKIQREVAVEINAFLEGFNSVLPATKLQSLSPSELEVIIAGASKIDVEDMKKHAKIVGNFKQEFLQWFWQILSDCEQDELSTFLYFVTGSTKVSFEGFKDQPIALNYREKSDQLPVAHTW